MPYSHSNWQLARMAAGLIAIEYVAFDPAAKTR